MSRYSSVCSSLNTCQQWSNPGPGNVTYWRLAFSSYLLRPLRKATDTWGHRLWVENNFCSLTMHESTWHGLLCSVSSRSVFLYFFFPKLKVHIVFKKNPDILLWIFLSLIFSWLLSESLFVACIFFPHAFFIISLTQMCGNTFIWGTKVRF